MEYTTNASSTDMLQSGQPEELDLLILGGGTGSTIAARTFAGQGKRVAVIDRKYIGGLSEPLVHRRCPDRAIRQSDRRLGRNDQTDADNVSIREVFRDKLFPGQIPPTPVTGVTPEGNRFSLETRAHHHPSRPQ